MSREGEDERERRDMRTSRRGNGNESVLIQPNLCRPGPRLVCDDDDDDDDGVPP
jgi:hypothetical protein